MNRRSESLPGNGRQVTLKNPVTGSTYVGRVQRWTLGDPEVRLNRTGEVRYFPKSWVQKVGK